MIIKHAFSTSWSENETILYVTLEAADVLRVGDMVDIPLRDGTMAQATICHFEPKHRTRYMRKQFSFEDGWCEFSIQGIPAETIADEQYQSCCAWAEEHKNDVELTPYKEIHGGALSIYDFIQEGFCVPEKVVFYLRLASITTACPGIYEHPFRKGVQLSGPYSQFDGHFWWDSNTWKYVVKYGLTLPQEFIDYVMSDEGTAWLEAHYLKCDNGKLLMNAWRQHKGLVVQIHDSQDTLSLSEF